MRWIQKKWEAWRLQAPSHYRRSLITILLLASLPGIIIGFVMFWFVKDQMEQELRSMHRDQLLRAADTINDHFNNAELLLAHWVFDPKFNEELTDLDFRYSYKEIHGIYRTLLVMEGSNPLFEKVELYIDQPKPVVFTKAVYKVLDSEQSREPYEQLLDHPSSLYYRVDGQTISLVHQIPAASFGASKWSGAIVIQFNEAKVLNLVQMLTPYNDGTTFLIDENGRMLMNDRSNEQNSERDQALYDEVMQAGSNVSTDTFLFHWKKDTFAATYGQFNRLGTNWYYVSAAPLTTITSPLVLISKLIIGMNLFILLLAGVLSWLASRRLYSPIARLLDRVSGYQQAEPAPLSGELPDTRVGPVRNEFELIEWQWNHLSRESQIMQTHLDKQLPHLREGFLMQLMQGYMHPFSEKELRDRMENYGWMVSDRQFAVVLVQLLGFARLEGRFSEGDEGLVTFAAANIAEELVVNAKLQADVINFHDLSLGLLVLLDSPDQRDTLEVFGQELIQYLEQMIKLQVTVVISQVSDQVKRVPIIYEEAKLSLRFRDVQGSSQIIDLEQLDSEGLRQGVDYPFELEKEITYALRLGEAERANEQIRLFMSQIAAMSPNEAVLKQAVQQLLGSILHVVMQAGIHVQELYAGQDLYAKISQIHDPRDIAQWFEQRVVQPFINEWQNMKDRHMRRLVENTIIILNQEYMTDLSLEYCADQIKISPYVLSKAFKRITGMNFIDYLTKIRMDQAKRLLCDSDWKISEIAEKVGYQNSYFNRLFKKHEQLTPGQYREQCKEKDQR